MKDHEVVAAFVAHLALNGYPGLRVDIWPERENRKSPDIEAIAGQFAIEHTSISTFLNQKAKDGWFYKAMAGIESELPTPPYELVIYSEYDAAKKGQDWSKIRDALKTWIIQKAPQLADGEYDFDSLPAIPFSLRVEKSGIGRPGIYFTRRLPGDTDTSQHVRIREQLDPKVQKLIPYKNRLTTVLLIEGNLTRNKMLQAIKLAFPDGLHPDLDELWYVSTWGNHLGQFTKLPKWVGTKMIVD